MLMVLCMEMKNKLISFPKEVLDVLEDYKRKTGITASDYIRDATIRRMIVDGLIFFKIKYVDVNIDGNGQKKSKDKSPPEEIKYCDGDRCEIIFPIIDKKKC